MLSNSTPLTCRLVTLGCKVNQYETQYVKEALESAGWREAEEHAPADLCIVNTCTVTGEGDAKSRQLIRRLHHANPAAQVVVMGCYATRDPAAVGRLPGVTRVITDKTRLADELADFGVVAMPAGITRFDGHQRAFVKVQDGCLLNCTFCIIPSVRPSLRSRPAAEIVAEVAGLVERGYQEVVLTGIHLGHYGIDLSRGQPKAQWCRLWHLLERLAELPGDFRIRLSSLEAAEARDDLIGVMARYPGRIAPHLHLCLQSGSDNVLARMKRRYRSAGFLERCRRVKEALDRPALTTDVIVGFPGETDADFDATCRVVREVGFAKLHVFSYSPRAGTPAAAFGDAVPPGVIEERRVFLRTLEMELALEYHRSMIGRQLEVLVEGADPRRPGHAFGTACRGVPVSFPGYAPALLARLVPVRAVGVAAGVLLGEPEVQETRRPLPLVQADAVANRPEGVMERPYQQVEFRVHDGVCCVHLKQQRVTEEELEQLGTELARLIDEDGCRKMVLHLGPDDFECLYSIFLAKLINLQRRLESAGGTLALASLSDNTLDVFRSTGLEKYFKFFPDTDAAVKALNLTALKS